jgi:hypothetical protein
MQKFLHYKNKMTSSSINDLSLLESFAFLKHMSKAKFIETVEVHVNTKFKKFNKQPSKIIIFPHSINKKNKIFGIDNLNPYYDVKLKKDRLKILKEKKNFSFLKLDITNFTSLKYFFKKKNILDTHLHEVERAIF